MGSTLGPLYFGKLPSHSLFMGYTSPEATSGGETV